MKGRAKMNGCVAGGAGGVRMGRRMRMVAVGLGVLLAMGVAGAVAQETMEEVKATILQDFEEMVVNERLGCFMESDMTDVYGFGFDEAWFVGTSGDQDDDMPYEYFHYYVKQQTATNAMGVRYVRFDLRRARMLMSVGDQYGVYALEKGTADWWNRLGSLKSWDDKVLAENVVKFDLYCFGADERPWMLSWGGSVVFDSRQSHPAEFGVVSNVPPMRIEVELQVTSPEAAMEGGMAMATGQSRAWWEMMLREAETHTLRAEPIGGSGQLAHPANHYSED